MKALLKTIFIVAIITTIAGCDRAAMSRLLEERDSLRNANEQQQEMLSSYGQTIDLVTGTLDSIAYQEGMLFVNDGEMPLTKMDIKRNLERFENLLNKQQEKIGTLERQLAASKDSTSNAARLVARLKEEVRQKTEQIEQLTAELETKNLTISQLQQRVQSQQSKIDAQATTISDLTERNNRQNEALARQDAILNYGYVLIGSGSDLKQQGIVKKGQLVAGAALDRSKFRKIDIRKVRDFTFQAKRPRILTNMPASSYELTTSGNKTFTLHINSTADFWGISHYLVIQTD